MDTQSRQAKNEKKVYLRWTWKNKTISKEVLKLKQKENQYYETHKIKYSCRGEIKCSRKKNLKISQKSKQPILVAGYDWPISVDQFCLSLAL